MKKKNKQLQSSSEEKGDSFFQTFDRLDYRRTGSILLFIFRFDHLIDSESPEVGNEGEELDEEV